MIALFLHLHQSISQYFHERRRIFLVLRMVPPFLTSGCRQTWLWLTCQMFPPTELCKERWKGRREREGRGGEVGGRGGEKMRSRRYEGRREGRGGDEGEEGIFANIRHWHYEYHYTISPSPYCVYWVQSGLIDGFLSISDNTTKRAPFSLLHKGSSASRPWQIAQAHNTSM